MRFVKTAGLVLLICLVTVGLVFAGGKQEETVAPAAAAVAVESSDLGLGIWASPAEFQAATGRTVTQFNEAPMLAQQVAEGNLPQVSERLPAEPMVVSPTDQIGPYGGTLNFAVTTAPEVIFWTHEGFTAFNPDGSGETVPSVVRSFDWSNDNRTVTFRLREGLRWSDGEPFTTEDVQFWWEDVVLNSDLTPTPHSLLSVGGELGTLAVVDRYTFTMTFVEPYPIFTMYLGSWGFPRNSVLRPKHYLKQFHVDYADSAELDRIMRAEGHSVWTDLFDNKSERHNPELPSMSPWIPTAWDTEPVQRWVRNPYHFRVDVNGNQLPYVDEILSHRLSDSEAVALKLMSGELDFARLGFAGGMANMPLLRENMQRGGFNLDHTGQWMPNSFANIMFNFTHVDEPAVSELYRDVRFRRALSTAIDREEINDIIYNGQMVPSQVAPFQGPPFYGESDKFLVYTQHDPDLANRLLDEIGLTARDREGYRLGLDGQPLRPIIYATLAWPVETVEVMELVREHWDRVGIRVAVRGEAGPLWAARHNNNEHDMSARGAHLGGGPVHPTLNQNAFALGGWQWAPEWARWLDSNGQQGFEPPDDVKRLRELHAMILREPDLDRQNELINEAYQIHMDNLWSIGIVRDNPLVGQQRIVNNRVKNVAPEQAGEPDSGYFAQVTVQQ
ncbi:MAG: ABC transporter substrate-binding protein [Spirochaetaceae bacterium]|nr:MAG: ABC transporter substrate-binding protein [Spirochaetaceae bacterium]